MKRLNVGEMFPKYGGDSNLEYRIYYENYALYDYLTTTFWRDQLSTTQRLRVVVSLRILPL